MGELKALIFDVDGTLAETERYGHRVAFNRAFAEANLDWDWSESLYGNLLEVSGGKERIRYYLQQYQPQFQSSGNLLDFIVNLHQLKNQHFEQLVGQGVIPLRTGVKRLLESAKVMGIRCAIATTSSLTNVLALLEKTLGVDSPSWFEVIAAGDIVPHKKPAADIYQYVLEQMNLNPNQALVFEDSQAGLQAAQQVGLSTIVTVNEYTQGQDFSGANLVINHLGEPEQPFQVLFGNPGHQTYVSIEFLRKILN